MKNVIFAAALASVAVSASAGQCVALDYQEMKEMPLADLKAEYCKANAEAGKNLDEGISDINRPRGQEANHSASDNFDQCMGQAKRIERLLGKH